MWVIKLVLSLGISWTNVLNFIRSAIDLIAVWFLLYYFISMFKSNMKTMQLFKGVLFILIVKLMTSVLGLTTLNLIVLLIGEFLLLLLFFNLRLELY